MNIHILTIFPNMFETVFSESIVKRAVENNSLSITIHNLRDYTDDNYKSVDDTPYGGGAGMVMKIDPIYKALKAIKKNLKGNTITLVTSAKGERYTQKHAKNLSTVDNIIIICGHYEGIDERVIKYLCDKEISIGDYVLSGGEIASMVIVDSIARLLPNVLGNKASLEFESHDTEGVLEYPQYTKPSTFILDSGEKLAVPEELLSGDPKKIQKWQQENIIQKTS